MITSLLFAIGTSALALLCSTPVLAILQQSGYKVRGVRKWLVATGYDYLRRYFALSFFSTLMMLGMYVMLGFIGYISYLGALFGAALYVKFFICSRRNRKINLRITKRAARIMLVLYIFLGAVAFALSYFPFETIVGGTLIGLLPLFILPLIYLSTIVLKPLEKLIASFYLSRCRKKLLKSGLIKIGITGSYGKTTTKKVLAHILAGKYNVVFSPASYNTPMGISVAVRAIEESTEVFIAEMGARHIGDIEELVDIVHPQYVMLTSIGDQHLETFGTRENIVKGKSEIFVGAEFAVINRDCVSDELTISCEHDYTGKGTKIYCDQATITPDGTKFDIHFGHEVRHVRAPLICDYLPSIIASCSAMAIHLGMTPDEIAERISTLEPIEHRLQVMHSGCDVIIDDSYNSNPSGAESALRALELFDGVRIIITPGFVEMGQESESANVDLGKKVAQVCDYAYFTGPNCSYLVNGANMTENKCKVSVVATRDEAVGKLAEIVGKKVVLFENDLPDNIV